MKLPGAPSESLAVDVNAAAKLLGVCSKTVRSEIDKNQLRAFRVGGKILRIRLSEIEAYMKRQEETQVRE